MPFWLNAQLTNCAHWGKTRRATSRHSQVETESKGKINSESGSKAHAIVWESKREHVHLLATIIFLSNLSSYRYEIQQNLDNQASISSKIGSPNRMLSTSLNFACSVSFRLVWPLVSIWFDRSTRRRREGRKENKTLFELKKRKYSSLANKPTNRE